MSDQLDLLARKFVQGTPQMMDIGLALTHAENYLVSMALPPLPDLMVDPARDLMHPVAI